MSITLIVGLGNPGPRYSATRHNAGFWLVDQLAVQAPLRSETKFYGEVGRITLADNLCWLLKPSTFMNRSGQAVAALANYYKISVPQILVIHDDLDFPAGTIRLKSGGGDCKHNGLKSIIAHLGSPQFMRLRIGIGHPGRSDDVTPYVLSAPSRSEQSAMEAAMNVAVEVIPMIVAGEVNRATQKLHTNT